MLTVHCRHHRSIAAAAFDALRTLASMGGMGGGGGLLYSGVGQRPKLGYAYALGCPPPMPSRRGSLDGIHSHALPAHTGTGTCTREASEVEMVARRNRERRLYEMVSDLYNTV